MSVDSLNTFQALRELASRGVSITRPALYLLATRYGIGTKENDGVHYSYDKAKLLAWANKKRESLPGGAVTLLDASELFQIPISSIYKAVKDKKLNTFIIGAGRGTTYVLKSDVKKYKECNYGKPKKK